MPNRETDRVLSFVFQASSLQQLEKENEEAAQSLEKVVSEGEAILAEIQSAREALRGLTRPFDYAYLIFAAFWGFVFFEEIPDTTTVWGMVLIAAAGILVLWVDRQEVDS